MSLCESEPSTEQVQGEGHAQHGEGTFSFVRYGGIHLMPAIWVRRTTRSLWSSWPSPSLLLTGLGGTTTRSMVGAEFAHT